MKKYTVILHSNIDIQRVIAWCEKSFGKEVIIPQNRKNWWDKRALERSNTKKRWQYKVFYNVSYSVAGNSPFYSYDEITLIRHYKFSFLNESDYTVFKITWSSE